MSQYHHQLHHVQIDQPADLYPHSLLLVAWPHSTIHDIPHLLLDHHTRQALIELNGGWCSRQPSVLTHTGQAPIETGGIGARARPVC